MIKVFALRHQALSGEQQETMGTKQSHDQPSDTESMYDDIVEVFSDVFGKLMRYATDEWANVEISTAQIKVIFVLHFGGTHTVNQLAERLTIGQSTASRHIEKLVQAGFASRHESSTDRRIIDVDLTEQGHAVADRLSGITQKGMIAYWIAQLTEDQRTDLGNSLSALLRIIENSAE